MLDLIDPTQFDGLKAAHDVLVAYFTTSSCGVGEALLPKVSELLEDRGVFGVVVNATDLPAVGGQHLVLTFPTIVVFVEGRELDRLSRHISVAQVERLVDQALRLFADDGEG